MSREEYFSPVGHATEPADSRRRWVSRILLAMFVVFIAWLAVTRVFNPPEDSPSPVGNESQLPGPI